MSQYQLTRHRIHKQLKDIQSNPIENTLVAVKNQKDIHFCFYNISEHPYNNGFYYGVLELPQNYPFSAPRFKFLTNNGRFEVGKYVCTTFTSYHQEAWSSSWSIRTILLGIISFFLSDESGFGTVSQSKQKRQYLAEKSLQSNLINDEFREMFGQKLKQMGIRHRLLQENKQTKQIQMAPINYQTQLRENLHQEIIQVKEMVQSVVMNGEQLDGVRNNNNRNNNSNRVIYFLYGVLLSIIVAVILRHIL